MSGGITPIYNLPYQTVGDGPNGALVGRDLAQAVEVQLARLDSLITTLVNERVASASDPGVVGIPDESGENVWITDAGPSVTVNIGASGRALVLITCRYSLPNYGPPGRTPEASVAYTVSGATTRGIPAYPDPIPGYGRFFLPYTPGGDSFTLLTQRFTTADLAEGLNPGSTTFALNYRLFTDNWSYGFEARNLTVMAL